MTEVRTRNKKEINSVNVVGRKKRRSKRVSQIMKSMILGGFLYLRYYVDIIIDTIFGLYYDSKQERVPNTKNPILLESATSLAKKIRQKKIKVEEVVQAFIDRIKEVNPIINSVVDNRFDDALAEARKLDKEIEIGEISDVDFQIKPFLGVPFTTKESTAVKGLAHSFGLIIRKNKKANEDAEVVKRMKDAGGILLGVTNIPQLNMWQETNCPVYGMTKNPYNSTRNVGGSSGGESSILAAGGSAIGIGSDIGGSLRIPAFMCGIYGHKPTCDMINTRGLTYRTGNEKDSMVVPGPMTRYAEDIIPLFKVLLNSNEKERLNLDKKVDVEDLNIYYIDNPNDPFISPMREEMTNIFNKVLNHFKEMKGHELEKLEFGGTKYGGKLWRYWMTQEPGSNFRRDLTDRQGEVSAVKEIFRYFVNRNNYSLATIFNLINYLLPQEKANWAKQETDTLRKQIIDKLGDNGVLLYPSAPWPASYHHTAFLRPWNFNLFGIWNALKFPVTQIPLGLNEQGLPLGIQVVAAPYQDRLAIAVARHLEKKIGGYVPPFQLIE